MVSIADDINISGDVKVKLKQDNNNVVVVCYRDPPNADKKLGHNNFVQLVLIGSGLLGLF